MGILRDLTPSATPKKINNTTLAYVAGIMDGEGFFSSAYTGQNKKYCYVKIGVGNTDKGLIDFLHETFGGNIQEQGPMCGRYGKKTYYIWLTVDKTRFCKLLKPYIRIKRRQLEVALALHSLPNGSPEKRLRLAEKLNKINNGEVKIKSTP